MYINVDCFNKLIICLQAKFFVIFALLVATVLANDASSNSGLGASLGGLGQSLTGVGQGVWGILAVLPIGLYEGLIGPNGLLTWIVFGLTELLRVLLGYYGIIQIFFTEFGYALATLLGNVINGVLVLVSTLLGMSSGTA